MKEFEEYTAEAVVIGGGHAGAEAALALARTGLNTVMLTLNLDGIGFLPCNPSIGGTAKGHLVREIDALGGEMGIIADQTALQMRMLNAGKGAAVQCLRAQTDKAAYHREMKRVLENTKNLRILQAEAAEILTENGACAGVKTTYGGIIRCRAVIVCTGVYLNSQTITGELVQQSGPNGFSRATRLTASLAALGYKIRRFKTGTPARVDGKTVNFSACEEQKGDEKGYTFSYMTSEPLKNTASCHLTYTNALTHKIILENLDRSPLYNGAITSTGPRYCPSVETKIVRFKDKERHQIFLEPEGADTSEIYVQGMSTSMPHDIQRQMYASVAGLEHADIVRYGYAIEYDCIDTLDVLPTLEFKKISGIYTAGQINGTSGYEEAAAQGLIAGLNASLKLRGMPPLVLRRDQAYIGVLIDDLVTKGTDEPYRMMTSRAEHRLSLRQDNADLRLTRIAYKAGLATRERMERTERKASETAQLLGELRKAKYTPGIALNDWLEKHHQPEAQNGLSAVELLKRPEITLPALAELSPELGQFGKPAQEQAEISVKYEGYLERQETLIRHARQMEETLLPEDLPYEEVTGLRIEARQKLMKQRPRSLAAASRIPGVSPADVAVLMVFLEKHKA